MNTGLLNVLIENHETNDLYNEKIEYEINELINEHYPVLYMDIHNTYHDILETPGKNHSNKLDLEILLKRFILDVNRDGFITVHHAVLFLMYNLNDDVMTHITDDVKNIIKKDFKQLLASGEFSG